MADLPLGSYRAVGFAGQLEAGTSGTCNITQGNVGVFDGDKLVALAYGKSAEDTAIGNLTPLEGGAVRVWDGDIVGSPVGDLRVEADGTVRLGRLADEESVCKGKAVVPNVYGMPIDKARKALADKGWKPVRVKPDGESRQSGLIKRGIVEVESCAGTGLAYCSFSYAARPVRCRSSPQARRVFRTSSATTQSAADAAALPVFTPNRIGEPLISGATLLLPWSRRDPVPGGPASGSRCRPPGEAVFRRFCHGSHPPDPPGRSGRRCSRGRQGD